MHTQGLPATHTWYGRTASSFEAGLGVAVAEDDGVLFDKHQKPTSRHGTLKGSSPSILHSHLVQHLHLYYLLAGRKVDLAVGSAWRLDPAAPVAHRSVGATCRLMFPPSSTTLRVWLLYCFCWQTRREKAERNALQCIVLYDNYYQIFS